MRVDAKGIISDFDRSFQGTGKNALKAMRDMIEHFDDYAAGEGRGDAGRLLFRSMESAIRPSTCYAARRGLRFFVVNAANVSGCQMTRLKYRGDGREGDTRCEYIEFN